MGAKEEMKNRKDVRNSSIIQRYLYGLCMGYIGVIYGFYRGYVWVIDYRL